MRSYRLCLVDLLMRVEEEHALHALMLEELADELDGEARNLEERLKKISKQKPQGDGVH